MVRHVFREANRGANSLAKGACSLSSDFVVLDAPPTPEKGFVVLENRHYSEYYFLKPIETLQIYPTRIIIIICVFIFN